ncbi:hypothetical protein [Streptomyces spiralis]|uniref:hypothetical protein n=1 Tax=Streptomyces spiralis TaxID=66376 RepID=UPI0033D999B2
MQSGAEVWEAGAKYYRVPPLYVDRYRRIKKHGEPTTASQAPHRNRRIRATLDDAPDGSYEAKIGPEFVSVLLVTYVVAPFLQSVASQAATAVHEAFRAKLRSLLADRELHGRWTLVVLQTSDGRLTVEIPGNLPEDAHTALERDLVSLIEGARGRSTIRIVWHARKRKWKRVRR